MIEVDIPVRMLNKAFDLAGELGELNSSIRSGEGNLIGFLGELVVAEYLNTHLCNTYEYDLIPHGIRIDVKSKECRSKPKPDFECSIADYNTAQNCDIYVFVRVWNKLKRAWIVGWEFKEDYFENARFLRKGEYDERNDFTVKANCYNVSIKDLKAMDSLRESLIY